MNVELSWNVELSSWKEGSFDSCILCHVTLHSRSSLFGGKLRCDGSQHTYVNESLLAESCVRTQLVFVVCGRNLSLALGTCLCLWQLAYGSTRDTRVLYY